MKFKKDEIEASLFEGLIEIILTLLLCAVGFGLCYGFGTIFKVDLGELDFDSYALIGIAALVVIGVIIGKVVESLHKSKKRLESHKETQKEVTQ